VPKLAIAIFIFVLTCPAGADQKTLARTQENRIASQDKLVSELRNQLDQARAQTATRVEVAKAGLETLNHELQAELDQARTDTSAARTITAAKEALIRALSEQLEQAKRERPETARVAAIAETAVKTAVKAATIRHAEDAAELKRSTALAATAAANSEQAAHTGEDNGRTLQSALNEIITLTQIIETSARSETLTRRLLVILAACLVGGAFFIRR